MLNAPPESGADPLVGKILGGRYKIDRIVGRGGAGVIYLANHVELGRPAAVKVLGAAWASDESAIERFQREARSASNVGHRNIVDVHDMGLLADGRPYLVMEWLEGQELGSMMESEGTLDPWLTANVVWQAGSALDAVHAKGIVHRDIKPENFFLHLDEDGTQVLKLLDFGLAAIHRPGADAARLTRQGVIHGTPHYMAPEATGADLPDSRADVYSLTVVAFEMLTGMLPFDSENPMQILTEKITRDPPRLSEVAGRPFPEGLEQVVTWGLARDPDQRCPTAGQFAQAFSEAVRDADWDAYPAKISGVHPSVSRGSIRPRDPSIPPSMPPGFFGSGGVPSPLPAPPPMPRGLGSVPPPAHSVRPGSGRPGSGRPGSGRPGPLSAPPGERETLAPPATRSRVLLFGLLLLAFVTAGTGIGFMLSQEDEGRASGSPTNGPQEPALPEALPEVLPEVPGEEPAGQVPGPETQDLVLDFSEAEASVPEGAETVNGDAPPRVRRVHHRQGPLAQGTPGEGGSPSMETGGAEAGDDTPRLAETDRERAQELSRQGTSALLQGRLPDAIQLFREATLAHPGNAAAWRGLGLANERLGRGPEAVRAYERYLRVAPNARDAEEVRARVGRLGG